MVNSFDNFVTYCKKYVPDLEIAYKDQSLLMKILGVILFFNPKFLTSYITTIGSTIYFPTKNSEDYIVVLHELTHIKDSNKYTRPIYSILYLFPQILSLLFLVLCLFSWKIFVPLTLLFLAPLPAYFRMYFELRAYLVGLYAVNKLSQKYPTKHFNVDADVVFFKSQFNNSGYYFMWPFGLDKQFSNSLDLIKQGKTPFEDTKLFEMVDDLISHI